jgi:ABC-2 type transport system permease protein
MSPRIVLATSARVLAQLRHDPRTVALLLVVPCVLMALMKWVFAGVDPVFQRVGVPLLGLFPLISMFLVTSITMLRERTSGTLERLMTMPLAKLDLLLGYAGAFGLVATLQATLVSLLAFGLLGLDSQGPTLLVAALAIANALLGMALGLLVSAFASSEFQAVQFMPAVIFPQLLLCGLLASRDGMADALRWLSDVLPMTYAYDALSRVALDRLDARLVADLCVVGGSLLAALGLAALTLRRRTA